MRSSSSLGSQPAGIAEQARALVGGRRAMVIGLAREGVDLTRFLSSHGASVLVTDQKPAHELQQALAVLGGTPGMPADSEKQGDASVAVTYRLGGHSEDDLARIDVVYASPGVPPEHQLVQAARKRGIQLSSLVELFFALCPAPIVGVTGSAGKSTTTSLIGDIFTADGREVFVGGNIGRPLLGKLEHMSASSWVIMELSSFQLEPLRVSPHISLVTNVTPNHLDRHPNMQAYWAAKGQILAHQAPTDWAVLNADDAWTLRYRPRGRVLHFSLEGVIEGAYLAGQRLMLLGDPLLDVSEVPLRGRHNLANVLAAMAATHAAAIDRQAMRAAVQAFKGVPHRLQTVADRDGVLFVDDSIATAPERSIAALRAYDEPLVLVAGGRDKHLPMQAWTSLIAKRVKHVVLLGEMSDRIAEALHVADPSYSAISRAASMDEAVAHAARVARAGDVVLLSPGGTSYDMYRDFEERGRDFARAVSELHA
ncbi:MAG: UDP-N-acetylmuramoyl-L-alanine--D-glutamate ligase [Chloroflexota bacterium]|nr:UDP-N-acetylmuramoyl-L-alanine--D-glutamate ligase [Chloroflexota bacterium]